MSCSSCGALASCPSCEKVFSWTRTMEGEWSWCPSCGIGEHGEKLDDASWDWLGRDTPRKIKHEKSLFGKAKPKELIDIETNYDWLDGEKNG